MPQTKLQFLQRKIFGEGSPLEGSKQRNVLLIYLFKKFYQRNFDTDSCINQQEQIC